MDAARAGGYDMRSRVGLPDKIAALFANLRVQALPDVTCSKLTVTAVVEGGIPSAQVVNVGWLYNEQQELIHAITW